MLNQHTTSKMLTVFRQTLPHWVLEILLLCAVSLAAIIAGFIVSFPGILMWDDHYRIEHSTALLKAFGLQGYARTSWSYAPLWELILGIANHFVFADLHDELWVRHSLTFALFPISIYLTFKFLRYAGVSVSTSLLCAASLLGIIRLGGHSLFNTKDLPAALAYLLCTLGIWAIISKNFTTQSKKYFSILSLAALGILAILPFLTRSPLLLHLVLLEGILIALAIADRRKVDLITRCTTPLIPLLTGALCIFLLYPPMWRQAQQLNASTITSAFLVASLFVFTLAYVHFAFRGSWRDPRRIGLLVLLIAGSVLIVGTNLSIFTEIGVQLNNSFREPYDQFSEFGWTGSTMIFGEKVRVENLPWWYAFAWIPVIAHPVVLICALCGYVALLFRRASAGKTYTLTLWKAVSLRISLERWTWLIVLLSFTAVATIKPVLYNDERHILFLYPTFFVLGLLGLDFLHRWIKCALAGAIVIASVFAYVGWGRYSYTYVSNLVPTQYRTFTGDYWGICMSHALSALIGNVPKGALVRIDGPKHLAFMQADRFKNTQAFSFEPDFDYTLIGGNSFPTDEQRPFAVMTHTLSSVYYYRRVLQDIEAGNAEGILVRRNPYNEAMCILAYYAPINDQPASGEIK